MPLVLNSDVAAEAQRYVAAKGDPFAPPPTAPGNGFDPSHMPAASAGLLSPDLTAGAPAQSTDPGASTPTGTPAPASDAATSPGAPPPAVSSPNPAVTDPGTSILNAARTAIGSRYLWGGPGGRSDQSPTFAGSDCSGFVSWAMHQAGIDLPAQTASAYGKTAALSQKDAQPGDVIFFNMGQNDPHQQHIAIYAGNGQMIHDSSVNPNGGVEVTPVWAGAEFRRPTGAGAAQAETAVGAATKTTAELSGGGTANPIGDTAHAMLSGAGQIASWLGDQGQKALQAVLVTEGGMTGARGDSGKSAGPLQFFEGGQLANFARQTGQSLEQAKTSVEQDPLGAIRWAIGTPDKPGYLGAAIQDGLQQGLSGADLATHAQRVGQVSVSPERAGQNYTALFGNGSGPVADATSQAAAVYANNKPDPFAGLGDLFNRAGQTKDTIAQQAQDYVASKGDPFAGLNGPTPATPPVARPVAAQAPAATMGGLQDAGGSLVADAGSNAPGGPPDANSGQSDTTNPVGNALGAAGNAIGGAFSALGSAVNPQQSASPAMAAPGNGFDPSNIPITAPTGTPPNSGQQAPPIPQPTVGDAVNTAVQQPDALAQAGTNVRDAIRGVAPGASALADSLPPVQSGIDPYRNIVQQGVPDIVQGIQTGDVGKALGGVWQTINGALSVVPGGGHAAGAVGDAAAEGARSLESAGTQAGEAATPDLLRSIQQDAADRIAWDDLHRSVNQDAAKRVADDAALHDPANYDQYGVWKGFEPPNPITYDKYGVQEGFSPPTPKGDLAPAPSDLPTPPPASPKTADLLQGAIDTVRARGGDPATLAAMQQELDRLTAGPVASAASAAEPAASAAPAAAAASPRALRATPASRPNPFVLSTEPTPGATPMSPADVASHVEALDATHAANQGRISELENRIQGGSFTLGKGDFSGTVVRPPWAAGYTDDALRELASRNDVNPYQSGWWEEGNFVAGTGEMRENVGASGLRGTGQTKQTATAARAELKQLYTEQDQISAAIESLDQSGPSAQFYKPAATDLPFDYNGADGGVPAASAAASPAAAGQAPAPPNPRGNPADSNAAPGSPAAPDQTGLASSVGYASRDQRLIADELRNQAIDAARAGLPVDPELVAPGGVRPAQITQVPPPARARQDAYLDRRTWPDVAEAMANPNAQATPQLATTLGGAAAGGLAGNATTPDDASPLERAARIAGGAALGAGAGHVVGGLPRRAEAGGRPFDLPGGESPLSKVTPETGPSNTAIPQGFGQTYTDLAHAAQFNADGTAANTAAQQLLDRPALKSTVAHTVNVPTEIAADPLFPQPRPVSAGEALKLFTTGNLISSGATVTHVAAGAILTPAWTLARDTGRALVTGHPEAIGPEWVAAGKSVGEAFLNGISTAVHGRGVEQSGFETISGRIHGSRPDQVIGKTLAKTWETPGNIHGALQQFSQTIVQAAETGRLAALEATNQGFRVNSPQWDDKVSALLANPPGEIERAAKAAGLRAGYRGPLGAASSKVQELVKAAGPVGTAIQPIFPTPARIAARSIESSPLGFIGTLIDLPRYLHGGVDSAVTPLGERLGNNILGTAATGALVFKALDGTITGDGPQDPKVRDELMKEGSGWQRNSLYVPGIGYMDYSRLGQLALPLRLAGNIGDMRRDAAAGTDVQTELGEAGQRLAAYFETLPGIQTAADVATILHGGSQAQSTIAFYASSAADRLVPGGALVGNIATATDPYARAPAKGDIPARALTDLERRIPGLREQTPAARDVGGNPAPNPNRGPIGLLPRVGAQSVPTAPFKAPGLPPKYIGVDDPVKEQQIDAARSKLAAYYKDPKGNPKPTNAETALAGRYPASEIRASYSAAVKAQQQAKDSAAKTVTGAYATTH